VLAAEGQRAARSLEPHAHAEGGEALRGSREIDRLRDGQHAVKLTGPQPRRDLRDDDDLRAPAGDDEARPRPPQWERIGLACREPAQEADLAVAVAHLPELDPLPGARPELQLVGRQIADRRLVGGDDPPEPRQLRQRHGAGLHPRRGLAHDPVELGRQRVDLDPRRRPTVGRDEQQQRDGNTNPRQRDTEAPFHEKPPRSIQRRPA